MWNGSKNGDPPKKKRIDIDSVLRLCWGFQILPIFFFCDFGRLTLFESLISRQPYEKKHVRRIAKRIGRMANPESQPGSGKCLAMPYIGLIGASSLNVWVT